MTTQEKLKEPTKATWASVIVYGLVSCWMYVIGMGISIFTGESDIAQIMVKAGLGIAGLLIIVFSTVTTTFLDAWSAGISSESLSKNINGKWIAVAATVIGMIGAIVYPMDDITDFFISDRISLCTNDRCTDRRFLYPSSGFLKKICMYPEHACMGCWIYCISLVNGG